jgi:hypothetical protein
MTSVAGKEVSIATAGSPQIEWRLAGTFSVSRVVLINQWIAVSPCPA